MQPFDEIQFLRDRARRLREIAQLDPNSIARQLRDIAAEIEQRADELDQSRKRRSD